MIDEILDASRRTVGCFTTAVAGNLDEMPTPPQPPSRSIWLADAPDAPATTPRAIPDRADVVIVGAGISGLATASMLADRGLDVLVLDARGVARGATGHSSAKVSVLHELTAARIARRRGEAVAGHYVGANRFGFDWIASRVRDDGVACGWQQRTAVTYLTSEGSKQGLLRREADLFDANGVPVEVTSTVDLPFEVATAITVPDQAQFDPVAFSAGLGDLIVARGGTVVTGVRVTGVDGYRSGADVSTSAGDVRARHVIVATGLPFLDRGLLFARTEPESSYVLACDVEGALPDGMYLAADGPKRSLRTVDTADGPLLLVGGESHKTGQGGDTEERYAALARWADEHFGLRSIRYRFMTQDFMTPDHVPFAGPIVPGSDAVLIATGMNKWGFTNGVAAAAVNVARVLDDPAPAWSDAFSTGRLPLAGLDEVMKANANVAVNMAGGWLRALSSGPDPAPGDGRAARFGLGVVAVSRAETTAAADRGNGDGTCRVSGVCPHLGGILTWNPAERTWDCPLHGSRFERNGRLLHGPAVSDLAPHDD